ncbi:uncharacterized protein LOC126737621 [Anthonomus grandis grandis]|uniref:uncharacterized protein LOC126737621 n=1 Tax=Anthonomus grandis grandis TaxID=2921223 RepID=UPI002166955A|nr:uncharacterized protein LOC126737621 [Anthonomus grandis grandis]
MKIQFLCIFVLVFTRIIKGARDCIKLDVSITQKVENLGFHRDVHWLIKTNDLNKEKWLNSSCNAALRLDVGSGMYVNPDQAEDLKRLGKINIVVDGFVDVEAPAHEATKHTVYIFLNKSELLDKIIIKLPIHLRYHRSLMGGHAKVKLTRPLFLISCLENNIICGKGKKVTAPTSAEEPGVPKVWKNITYKADFEEPELLVPIGNLDDYPCVAIISCILGCAGCIYILSLTYNQNYYREKKQ